METRYGPGIRKLDTGFEETFFTICQDWFDQLGPLPVLLSGMVGSTIGWKDAPYLNCPVDIDEIANGRISFDARGNHFSILAGLKTINPLQLPDVMRGEELQLLGWQQLNPAADQERLFALPGTHNKWSLFKDNKIETFLSAFTGEMFALLRDQSILLSADAEHTFSESAFMQGVETAARLDKANILHALFSVRSRQVLGELSAEKAASYLSGLILSADVIGAYGVFNAQANVTLGVTVIGESALSQKYLQVLNHLDIPADYYEPTEIAIAGFSALYGRIYE